MNSPQTEESIVAIWTGRLLGALVVLSLLADAGVNVFLPHLLAENLAKIGFPMGLAPIIGSVLFVCVLLYMIPRTSVLGAVLITAFLGGAICAHLRIGEIGSPPQVISALLGIAAWASLYLRNDNVRGLLPLLTRTRI
ncbi:DoxX family protein [Halomonas sp. McH1-25]|uniref:DoxX family protein n=1 Tax=unclassified Halomonas TaxID=2609666 RepID=UPI001EF52C4A|nr:MULTISPECIES: DoxX family protein [unclassified Halomonas]MCG7600151.1 DoxX family protein [Halomonas sp. McH1-25]MCP1341400.1 DoxX family protein [Halomonas sp. FL8]MCP1359655.1 DoxX family protein [Halomonas sp. BBD45]